MDVLATMCDLADIETPATNEGISMVPVLTGQQETIRDTLYGAYNGGTKPGIRCVQHGAWKLIKYDVLNGGVRETQLFNLAENPLEFWDEYHSNAVAEKTGVSPKANQKDLAEEPQHAEKRAEMESLLLTEMQRLDDPYRLLDQNSDN